MGRKLSRNVWKTRGSSSQKRSEPAALRGQGGNEHGGSPRFQGGVEPGRAPAGEGREPVGCVELAMTHRSASRCYLLAPGIRGLPATFPWHLFSRPTPFAVGRKLASFSCSIPPLFVLSHSMPMINTTGKLASFWRFSLTTGSLPSDSPATILPPLATRHSPQPPTTLPHWLLPDTDSRIAKNRTGPIATSGSSISVCHRK